jgi:cytochrome c oxidase cbb3-type subunit I
LLGGALVLSGMFVMLYNVWKTIAAGKAVDARIPPVDPHAALDAQPSAA